MQKFLSKYNIKLVVKNKSNFMKAAGLVQTLFSRISYKEFMTGYTSTIGDTIYGEEGWIERIKSGTADCNDVALLVHETAHMRQFRDGSYTRYVRSGGRALLEAQAIIAANRFRVACGDAANVKTRPQIIAQLMKYGCRFDDAVAAAVIVEIAMKDEQANWPPFVMDAVTEFSK